MTQAATKRGWGNPRPMSGTTFHYFVDSQSLCGRWMFMGEMEDANHDHPDNCVACKKALIKKQEKEKVHDHQ